MHDDDDVRDTIDRFLVAAYERGQKAEWAQSAATDAIASELGVPPALAKKVADFLEREGLVDHEDQAVDLTVEGILRAESILRGRRKSAP